MTRFNITMTQALELVLRAATSGHGGEVFVPKLKSYTVGDLKDAIIQLMNKKTQTQTIPIRPGEKFHESLISKNESNYTFESSTDYIVYNLVDEWMYKSKKNPYKKSKLSSEYSSDNVKLLTVNELKKMIQSEGLLEKAL